MRIIYRPVIYLAVIYFVLAFSAFAQEAPKLLKCDHTSNARARFDHVRMLPPMQVESFDGKILRVADKFAIEEFYVDDLSIVHLPKDTKGKFFWILYCDLDRHLYVVDGLSPQQLKH